MKASFLIKNLLLSSAVLLLAGCGGSDSGSANSGSADNHDETPLLFSDTDFQSITTDEMDTLIFVREEEKLARDVYLRLYDQWQKPVFQNIANNAEQKHMDAVKILLDGYGLPDPVTSDEIGAFNDSDILKLYQDLLARGGRSLNDALHVGAYIEEYDIDDLENATNEALEGSNPMPIIETYLRLSCGSRNHLRAFVKQINNAGITYQAQLLDQQVVDLILTGEQEQCG